MKFEIDLAWEDSYETFADSLEALSNACESAKVRVVRAVGSGGGWPTLEISIDESDLPAFAVWFGGEGSTVEELAYSFGIF